MLQDILTQVEPALTNLAVVAIVYVLVQTANYISKATAKVKSSMSESAYKSALRFARGVFVQLEEEFKDKDIENAGEVKKERMTSIIKEQYPGLTDEELVAINKDTWNEMTDGISYIQNKDSIQ